VRDLLIGKLLKIRAKKGGLKYLRLTGAARIFAKLREAEHCVEGTPGGMTTYIAARFFLQTITRPGR